MISASTSGPQNGAKPAHHPWCYLNGDWVQAVQAQFPVTTQAFNYGTAVFEGIRGYLSADGRTLNVFRLDAHVKRLTQSAALLLIDLPEPQALHDTIVDLLQRNEARGDCYIRPIAFKQHLLPGSGFGVKLSGVSSGLSINSLNMSAYVRQDGLSCTVSGWRRVSDNAVPARAKITGSYVNSALAMEAASRGGFDDAIMLNSFGYVAEATTSNVFIVKDGRLITPPVTAHILEGITRDTVITLAKKYLNITVEQRDILPSELLTADECFLSGTGVEISAVRQIDHRVLNSLHADSITQSIKALYQQAVRGELEAFRAWLSPVGLNAFRGA